jgi:hypothetical protein
MHAAACSCCVVLTLLDLQGRKIVVTFLCPAGEGAWRWWPAAAAV